MTSNKSKTALKHLTTGLIFAESICNGFHYEGEKKKSVYRKEKIQNKLRSDLARNLA